MTPEEKGCLCAILFLLVALIAVGVMDNQRKFSRDTYAAWCKIEKRSDITYEEWKAARRAGIIGDGR